MNVRALLVSTYDLGRQPFGLASPAAWLRREGIEVDCVDTSREPLDDGRIAAAALVGFYLPMHTATRLAAPLIERVRRINPSSRLCAYGLYAPLNIGWLHDCGVHHVLGPEAEQDLVDLARATALEATASNAGACRPPSHGASTDRLGRGEAGRARPGSSSLAVIDVVRMRGLQLIAPDRGGLPAPDRYAALQMPDGSRRVVASTEATRGCKHLCRHCPIVPVYEGLFRIVPVDVDVEDVRAQVRRGAQHVSFGDPDFLNGPAHARRVVERIQAACPGLTFDATIKIEHLLDHADLLPVFRDSGCLFITSAVESIDDAVLEKLRKGHTRSDFIRAAGLCRDAGVTLAPTFIPFTPWTTLEGYVELLELIGSLGLVEHVPPIQLGIRLLVTARSHLLELPEISAIVESFDRQSLTYPWRHVDQRVDALQEDVLRLVSAGAGQPRAGVFGAIAALARERAGMAPGRDPKALSGPVPSMTEPWYCCAEPMQQF